jgi:hypothetical protein
MLAVRAPVVCEQKQVVTVTVMTNRQFGGVSYLVMSRNNPVTIMAGYKNED